MGRRDRPTGRRATIADIAREAGVSASTVSNVLNGRSNMMTEETLLRVQRVMADLDYRPSSVAASLATRRTASIGVILSEIETPLFLQALQAVETTARQAGYNILLCNARNIDDEHAAVNVLLDKEVDGILLFSTSVLLESDYLADLSPWAPPLVLINRAVLHTRFDQINWDSTDAMIEAIAYLAGLGHRHLAHLTGQAHRRSTLERLEGYRVGLERHGLPYRPEAISSGDPLERHEWERNILELLALNPRPTAILAAGDTCAAVTIRTLHRVGLRVPQDISVIGVDDQPMSVYLSPSLSTIRLPVVQAGKLGVEMLLERMARRRDSVQQLNLPCELVVRESIGPVSS